MRLLKIQNIHFTWNEKQVPTTFASLTRFCFLGTTPVLAPNAWTNENAEVDTHSRESNSGPYDCEAAAVFHNHGHDTTVKCKS